MRKTGKGLVEYARSKVGTPYVYGTKMETLTQVKYNSLKSMYGSLVWDSDAKKVGKVCCDCSGLISSYTGILRGSSGYKTAAKAVNPISTISSAPIGALVWLQGHIGVYSGMKSSVPYYIAEDGSAYGCREVPLSYNKFIHWFLCTDIEYVEEIVEEKEEEEMRYNTVNEVPDYAKEAIQALIDKGVFGDKNKLDLSLDMIRIFVFNYRAGLYTAGHQI